MNILFGLLLSALFAGSLLVAMEPESKKPKPMMECTTERVKHGNGIYSVRCKIKNTEPVEPIKTADDYLKKLAKEKTDPVKPLTVALANVPWESGQIINELYSLRTDYFVGVIFMNVLAMGGIKYLLTFPNAHPVLRGLAAIPGVGTVFSLLIKLVRDYDKEQVKKNSLLCGAVEIKPQETKWLDIYFDQEERSTIRLLINGEPLELDIPLSSYHDDVEE